MDGRMGGKGESDEGAGQKERIGGDKEMWGTSPPVSNKSKSR